MDRDDGKNMIAPEGFEKLCEKLGYNMEDIKPMILLWKLNGVELGTIEYTGWDTGLREMKAKNEDELQKAINDTLKGFDKDPAQFKAFYRRLFDYLLVEKQKFVSSEYATAMLSLVTDKGWVFAKFVEFLEANKDDVKVINRDQWQSLLEMSRVIKPDLSNYSKDDAWPGLFDRFVDWFEQSSNNSAAADAK
ncbi:defective in cullin neddylation 1 [Coemansia reversa NRRL 1564]|uniref:Defective in cullin neddylation protein n=1 Tax=Coemansia reversa (strain ATCC 12441 / NRRL 1564) TaxID=763665 RepID=A0A2G5BIT2_COERN|nr:defective in cullin neddylation 1 [Coemansia reversa NRRL 1564]|eukprot:PIA18944.1 defective in cullin neddylation 1 [Coemansia reversa NRRL 1564]